MSKATKDSTLVESGRKQGWSGFKILPSSGMQVCIQVSKKGTSSPELDSERITWIRERQQLREEDVVPSVAELLTVSCSIAVPFPWTNLSREADRELCCHLVSVLMCHERTWDAGLGD